MENEKTRAFVEQVWEDSIIPALIEYIRIPNKSPAYDAKWQENGHMERAVSLIEAWCRRQQIDGLRTEVVRLEGRTPLLFMEIPGASDDCALLYGHLDKQPEMSGWREGLGPWSPVLDGDRLYGRGGADDGYAVFASLAAILAVRQQRQPHARCVVIIEGCEESGSYDLPFYIDKLAGRIGSPSLIVCLDSGCGNYEQLWCTSSLRGLVAGDLVVELLKEGVHSGEGSGVVASSFRVVRQLLSRLEDEHTGKILPKEFQVNIPRQTLDHVSGTARVLGTQVYKTLPLREDVQPVTTDVAELMLNRTWRPALSITGAAGLPALENAGNVLRPMTALRVSLRIPPGIEATAAGARLKRLFEEDPPYGAKVRFEIKQTASGWAAPELSQWLARSLNSASLAFFGESVAFMGEGGSIPFMDMLGRRFPKAQFVITGVLGPNSNAHGPNEFLDIPTGKKITCSVAHLIADHYKAAR